MCFKNLMKVLSLTALLVSINSFADSEESELDLSSLPQHFFPGSEESELDLSSLPQHFFPESEESDLDLSSLPQHFFPDSEEGGPAIDSLPQYAFAKSAGVGISYLDKPEIDCSEADGCKISHSGFYRSALFYSTGDNSIAVLNCKKSETILSQPSDCIPDGNQYSMSKDDFNEIISSAYAWDYIYYLKDHESVKEYLSLMHQWIIDLIKSNDFLVLEPKPYGRNQNMLAYEMLKAYLMLTNRQ